jgi:hypothetical protein
LCSVRMRAGLGVSANAPARSTSTKRRRRCCRRRRHPRHRRGNPHRHGSSQSPRKRAAKGSSTKNIRCGAQPKHRPHSARYAADVRASRRTVGSEYRNGKNRSAPVKHVVRLASCWDKSLFIRTSSRQHSPSVAQAQLAHPACDVRAKRQMSGSDSTRSRTQQRARAEGLRDTHIFRPL